MSISITRYVDIISGVGGGAAVAQRDFSGLVFTTDERVPTQTLVSFTSAAEVEQFFRGSMPPSPMIRLATDYFGYVSPLISSPERLLVARLVTGTASFAWVRGQPFTGTLTGLKALSGPQLATQLTAPDGDVNFTVDLTAANSLSDVAAAFQTAMRAAAGAPAWATSLSCTYDATSGRFSVTTSVTPPTSFRFTATGQLAAMMGLLDGVASAYLDVQTPVEAFNDLVSRTNNFGGFTFVQALSVADATEVAAANHALNVEFLFSNGFASLSDADAFYAAAKDLSGAWSQHSPPNGDVAYTYSIIPLAILAATDFEDPQSVVNYMFKDFSLPATIDSNADADRADAARLNYMGQTQTAGQLLKFTQRGVLMGSATAPVDANVYANEMWLKDACRARLMSLLLSTGRVPANDDGRAMVRAILQDAIDRALLNGTISPGKPLTVVQQVYIKQITRDPRAPAQVRTDGYWCDVEMRPYVTTDGRTEWKAVYVLVYSKDDAIRKIEGTHVLI